MTDVLRYSAIHRRDGRLVALLPVASDRAGEIEAGIVVEPERGQLVSEIVLSAEQAEAGLAVLAQNFRVRREPGDTAAGLVAWPAGKKR